MECPRCQSAATQRAEVIFRQGTSTINTSSNTIGAAGGTGGLVVGTAKTSTTGTQQTALAAQCSPPSAKPVVLFLFAALVMFVVAVKVRTGTTPGFVNMTITVLAVAALFACLFYAYHWSVASHGPRLAAWKKLWHCNQCGHMFAEPGAYDAYNAKALQRRTVLISCAVIVAVGATAATLRINSSAWGDGVAGVINPDPGAHPLQAPTDARPAQPQFTSYADSIGSKNPLKPKYAVRTAQAFTVVDEGKTLCSIEAAQSVPTEDFKKVGRNLVATSFFADLCPAAADSEPRDERHKMSFAATGVDGYIPAAKADAMK